MRTKVLIAVVATTALMTTGCTGGADPGDTIDLPMGTDPSTLIPPNVTESEGGRIVESIYTGLTEYDENAKSYNVIAESIESKDNKTWTIELRDGFTFHNGEKVDAKSFKRAWDWGAYGPNAAGGSYFYDRIKGYSDVADAKNPESKELSGVEADGMTLTVTLDKAWIGFPEVLGYAAFAPMAKECVADIKACNEKPIGNGPFQLSDWSHDENVTLERYDSYAGVKPQVDTLEFTIYSEGDTCWADFKAGDIDMCSPPVEEWEAARDDPELSQRLVSQPSTSFSYLGFPVFREEFEDKSVRQAFNLAVDREEVIEVAMPGRAVPATSFTPENIPGGQAGTCDYCEFDPDRAKKLLEESDWPKDKKIEIWYNTDPSIKAVYEAVGNQIKQNLGVEFELHEEEWDPFLKTLEENDQTGPFRMGWSPDYPLNENYLKPIYGNGPDNDFGFKSEKFEDKLAEGDKADDLDTALESYREAEEVLGEEMPNIPLSFQKTSTFYSEELLPDSVKIHPIGGVEETMLQTR